MLSLLTVQQAADVSSHVCHMTLTSMYLKRAKRPQQPVKAAKPYKKYATSL